MRSIHPCKEACFRSKYCISDSISLLSASVKENRWGSRFGRRGLLGSVKPEEVILLYSSPWNKYSGNVQFKGSFAERDGSVVLCGEFELPKSIRIVTNCWLAVIGLLFLYAFVILQGESRIDFLTLPLALLVFGVGMYFLSIRALASNIENISQAITDTISKQCVSHPVSRLHY